jgi:uncharacterized protein with ParB-like and HNH nuclease domain
MSTKAISVFNFFTTSNLRNLVIPMFQRPYSWRHEQIQEFFNDLKPLLSNSNLTHFFGLVVLVKDDGNGVFEVIDGQQRLSTLSITLAILRDKLDDIKENNQGNLSRPVRNKIDEAFHKLEQCLTYKDRSGQKCLKLITKSGREYEQRFLENVLQSIPDLDINDVRYLKYQVQSNQEKNIFQVKNSYMEGAPFDQRKVKAYRSYKNFSIINEILESDSFLGGKNTVDSKVNFICDSLVPSLLDSIEIIDFVSENHSDAFNTFEVLNNRGLAISSTDLIKNICLKKATNKSEQDEIFKLWNSIFDQALINQDDIQFLRYSNNSRRNFVTKTELYDSFSNLIAGMNINQLKTFLESELLVDAQIFTALKNFDSVNWPSDINNAVRLLQSTKSNQWISIAISTLRAYDQFSTVHVSEKLVELLQVVHEISFSMILKERKANLIEQVFPGVAQAIVGYTRESEVIDAYTTAINRLTEFRDVEGLAYKNVDLLDVDFSSNNLNGALVLSFIEYKTLQGGLTIRSLEHILPQNPKDRNWPIINSCNWDVVEDNIYSIGNFLLIDKPLNSKVKASAFLSKKSEYGKYKIFDPVGPTSSFNYTHLSDFDFNSISNRAIELLALYNRYTQ